MRFPVLRTCGLPGQVLAATCSTPKGGGHGRPFKRESCPVAIGASYSANIDEKEPTISDYRSVYQTATGPVAGGEMLGV